MTTTPKFSLSIITPTWRRRRFLLITLRNLCEQRSRLGLLCEHLVISDGHDDFARLICQECGSITYHEMPTNNGGFGSKCRDFGIQTAAGEWLLFCDDDNSYYPHHLQTFMSAADGDADIVVCQMRHWEGFPASRLIPPDYHGRLYSSQVDCGCVLVRRELAVKEVWNQVDGAYDNDFRYFEALWKHNPRVRWVPTIVGDHIGAIDDPVT